MPPSVSRTIDLYPFRAAVVADLSDVNPLITFAFPVTCHTHTHTHEQLVTIIRGIETKYKHPICILADLQGPKLRVGVFGKDAVSFC